MARLVDELMTHLTKRLIYKYLDNLLIILSKNAPNFLVTASKMCKFANFLSHTCNLSEDLRVFLVRKKEKTFEVITWVNYNKNVHYF